MVALVVTMIKQPYSAVSLETLEGGRYCTCYMLHAIRYMRYNEETLVSLEAFAYSEERLCNCRFACFVHHFLEIDYTTSNNLSSSLATLSYE